MPTPLLPLLYYPDFYPDTTWLRSILLLTDSITRIVPQDVTLDDPPALRELAQELGALNSVAPKSYHIEPIGYTGEWLRRTLALIANSPRDNTTGTIRMRVSKRGDIVELEGSTLIKDQKIHDSVRNLLEENRLINHKAQQFAQKAFSIQDSTLVPTEAANAILSFIADNIARDLGYTAITTNPLDFAMNSLSGLNVPVHAPTGASEGLLASAVASVLVPKEVGAISFSDYKILREYSTDLRAAFSSFLQKFHASSSLHRIENMNRLREETLKAAKEIEKEFMAFQKRSTKTFAHLRDWWPVAVAGLLYCAKDFLPVDYALSTQLLAGGTFGLKFLERAEKLFVGKPDESKAKVFNLSSQLGTNILALPHVSELLENR